RRSSDLSIAISASCTGCTGSLEYSVNNGSSYQAGSTFNGLAPGNYNIKVRDSGNTSCEATYGSNPVAIAGVDADCDGFNVGQGDCNDSDPAINPNTQWFLDADTDNYYTGSAVTQCMSPGAGYKRTGLIGGGDCNDSDPAINPATQWFLDADNDNYYTGSAVTQCMSPGAGYKHT